MIQLQNIFQIRQLPESVIVETTEYKCLQSQFSVLYNESMQIKTMLDEIRNQLQTSKNQHLRQIEVMESEELIAQKKVRSEMIQMEDVLAQIRKEYESLRIEFEQNMAANEQTAPINREMRHLITSLQNHNGQLKGEVQRYKRKYKDASADNVKLRRELEETIAKLDGNKKQTAAGQGGNEDVKQEGSTNIKDENLGNQGNLTNSANANVVGADGSAVVKEEGHSVKLEEEITEEDFSKDQKEGIKKENASPGGPDKKEIQSGSSTTPSTTTGTSAGSAALSVKQEKDLKDVQKAKDVKIQESEVVRDLKAQLKYVVAAITFLFFL